MNLHSTHNRTSIQMHSHGVGPWKEISTRAGRTDLGTWKNLALIHYPCFKVIPSKSRVVFKSAESFVLWPWQISLAPGQSQIVLNSGFLLAFCIQCIVTHFCPRSHQCVEETQRDRVCASIPSWAGTFLA